MKLYDVTNCEWAKEKGQTTILEQRGLELTILNVLNQCSEELGEDEFEFRNYKLCDEALLYIDGEVHVLDGCNVIIPIISDELGEIYLSYAYKCASGQAILVCYKSLDDAYECENEILVSL